jgi:hypothetical protein
LYHIGELFFVDNENCELKEKKKLFHTNEKNIYTLFYEKKIEKKITPFLFYQHQASFLLYKYP